MNPEPWIFGLQEPNTASFWMIFFFCAVQNVGSLVQSCAKFSHQISIDTECYVIKGGYCDMSPSAICFPNYVFVKGLYKLWGFCTKVKKKLVNYCTCFRIYSAIGGRSRISPSPIWISFKTDVYKIRCFFYKNIQNSVDKFPYCTIFCILVENFIKIRYVIAIDNENGQREFTYIYCINLILILVKYIILLPGDDLSLKKPS